MQLRPATSSRPELVVDQRARRVSDPADSTSRLGIPGLFGRGRCLYALPLQTQWLQRPGALRDQDGSFIGDPDGNLIGAPGVLVHRILGSTVTEDTRRL